MTLSLDLWEEFAFQTENVSPGPPWQENPRAPPP
jgi:hypothetical protein